MTVRVRPTATSPASAPAKKAASSSGTPRPAPTRGGGPLAFNRDGSLGPTLVRLVAGTSSYGLGRLALFVLAGSGALTVVVVRTLAPRRVMFLGTLALTAGVAVTLVAVAATPTAWFFVGTAIAGVGSGAGFQGGLRTVIPLAAPHERAGVLSTAYMVCYLATGLPAVGAGFLVVHGGGVPRTAREYGIMVIALAAAARLSLVVRGRPVGPESRPA